MQRMTYGALAAAVGIGLVGLSLGAQQQTPDALADQLNAIATQVRALVIANPPPPPPDPVPAPLLNCPANQAVTTSTQSAVVAYPAPGVSGGVVPVIVVAVPASGSVFPIGVTTVLVTAVDAIGQTAVPCTFTVTVTAVVVPPPGFVLRDGSNTGLVGAGIAETSLAAQAGTTYGAAFNGQTITGKRFTGQVTVTASNFTIDGCLFEQTAGAGKRLLIIGGGNTNVTIRNSTFRTSSGSGGFYQAILQQGTVSGLVLERNNVAHATDLVSLNDSNTGTIIRENFLHDQRSSDTAPHYDSIEVYGGANVLIEKNTILMRLGPTAVVNVAPWSGSNTVTNLTIQDNYIDGGQGHFTIDQQTANASALRFTRMKRNKFGGHGGGGAYRAYLVGILYDGRVVVTTEAALSSNPNNVLLPDAGADVNVFDYVVNNPFGFANLSPDRTGQTVTGADFISGG